MASMGPYSNSSTYTHCLLPPTTMWEPKGGERERERERERELLRQREEEKRGEEEKNEVCPSSSSSFLPSVILFLQRRTLVLVGLTPFPASLS